MGRKFRRRRVKVDLTAAEHQALESFTLEEKEIEITDSKGNSVMVRTQVKVYPMFKDLAMDIKDLSSLRALRMF